MEEGRGGWLRTEGRPLQRRALCQLLFPADARARSSVTGDSPPPPACARWPTCVPSSRGESLKEQADVFQMAGRRAPIWLQRENDPTPTHCLQAGAKNTAKHVHNTSLCAADSNSCCSRCGSVFYTHPRAEPLSHFPVGLRSNQIVIRVSCAPPSFLPSCLPRRFKLALPAPAGRTANFSCSACFSNADADPRNCKMIFHNPDLWTTAQLHSSRNLFGTSVLSVFSCTEVTVKRILQFTHSTDFFYRDYQKKEFKEIHSIKTGRVTVY